MSMKKMSQSRMQGKQNRHVSTGIVKQIEIGEVNLFKRQGMVVTLYNLKLIFFFLKHIPPVHPTRKGRSFICVCVCVCVFLCFIFFCSFGRLFQKGGNFVVYMHLSFYMFYCGREGFASLQLWSSHGLMISLIFKSTYFNFQIHLLSSQGQS